MDNKIVGKSPKRLDIKMKVQGTRKFPQDFSMDGQLHMKTVWSEYPHAEVKKIDTAEAEAYSGVVRVLTYRDVPVNEYGIIFKDQQVLIAEGSKVRWTGDRVALVIAETEEAAEEARKLVRVDYEPLPVISDPREGMKEDAPLIHEKIERNILKHIPIRKGDVKQGFAEADLIIEGEYSTQCVEHAYLQPEAGLGYIDDEGRVTVICAAQWAHDDLHQIAHLLDLPLDQVREIVPSVGGAFGGREDMSVQHLLALAAFCVRQPVKMVWTREESMRGHGKRHPFYFKYKHGVKKDGTLVAVEIEAVADAGAYASTSGVVLDNATSFIAGPYVIPHVKVDTYTVHTNNTPNMAMRGFGATQPPFPYESQMDRIADAVGLDRVELRLKNILVPGAVAITGNEMPEVTGVNEALVQTAQAAGWREENGHWIKPDVGEATAPSKTRGIGIALGYKNVGYSFGYDDKSTANVELKMNYAGQIIRAVVRIGASEVGQGVQTALAQITAETLHISLDAVHIAYLDTANVPDAGSASASRHTYASGNAVYWACRKALEEKEAHPHEKKIRVEHTYRCRNAVPTTEWDPQTGQCNPHISYSFGAQCALVEVDLETGETELLKMWSANDIGKAINPQLVYGQNAGGVHMGVGYALMENFIAKEGYVKSRRFSEYHVPTVLDMPKEFVDIQVEVADPTGPYGATGLGETPTLPTAPAIVNAIADATGARVYNLPADAEAVWWALRKV